MYLIYNKDFANIYSFIICPNDKFHIPNSISSTVNAKKTGTSIRPSYVHSSQ